MEIDSLLLVCLVIIVFFKASVPLVVF